MDERTDRRAARIIGNGVIMFEISHVALLKWSYIRNGSSEKMIHFLL